MTKRQKYLLITTLLLGNFCMFLNQTFLTTAYPTLMKDFSISADSVQWLTTGFLLVTGVVIPLSGWLLHQVNTKILYLTSLIIFLLGTSSSFFATSFSQLLISRLIQAVGVGISMPLFQTVLLTLLPKKQRGSIMGIAGIVISLSPAIGPSLSGFILTKYTWHTLFLMLIPIIILALIMAVLFMRPVLTISRTKLDLLSLAESSIGLALLLYGLSSISSTTSDKLLVYLYILIGIFLLYRFLMRQLKIKNPFLSLIPFEQRDFKISCALVAIANMAMISFELVLPMYIQNVRHLSPLTSGLSLLPGALVLGIMSPISGKLFDKYGAKYLCMIGMTLLTVCTFPFIFIRDTTPMTIIIVLYAIRLLGISMVMMPVTTFGMNSLENSELSAGSVINKTMKQIASSLGTAIMISVMTAVTSFSHETTKQTKLLDGYHGSFTVATTFCIIALVLTFRIPKKDTLKTYRF